ncbi:MAG: response regulator [Verrucomicrobia bacterium]|jgi:FixJ family two-component response regulator|nr:response regulator [Verrucomicrobiota bacterium]
MNENEPYCLLLVDDDGDFRGSMRRLLWTVNDSFPVRVLEAPGGATARDMLRGEQVDCVLLDQRMPGGDGVDWIARLLETDAYLPIVMVTGQGDERTAVNAMKQGAMDYLVKGSISATALVCAVSNAIEKMTMRRAVEMQRDALLIAERHRVMIESLGAACHHLGQPMSVVTMCLDIMRRQALEPPVQEVVDQCEEAVKSVNAILAQLQSVSTYRTEPYLAPREGDAGSSGERILSIRAADIS